jgi:hypothetical protein
VLFYTSYDQRAFQAEALQEGSRICLKAEPFMISWNVICFQMRTYLALEFVGKRSLSPDIKRTSVSCTISLESAANY